MDFQQKSFPGRRNRKGDALQQKCTWHIWETNREEVSVSGVARARQVQQGRDSEGLLVHLKDLASVLD